MSRSVGAGEKQDQFRIEGDGGQTRNKAEQQATQHEQDRIGKAQTCRQGGEDNDRHHETKDQGYRSRHSQSHSFDAPQRRFSKEQPPWRE